MASTLYFARTTADQPGGIATVQLFGPGVFERVSSFFQPKKKSRRTIDWTQSHRLYYGRIMNGVEVIDETVVRGISSQESPVGQPLVEIHLHGGRMIVRRFCRLLCRLGFREVHENTLVELSWRSGRISLIQKEAYFILKRVRTVKSALFFNRYYEGHGFVSLRRLLRCFLEKTPFAEKAGVDQGREENWKGQLVHCLDAHLENYTFLRALVYPPQAVLVGPPNVGKSTLLNALAGFERVVSSPQAGTTRDLVGMDLSLDGFPVRLYDSPGILETAFSPLLERGEEPLDQQVMKQAIQALERKDILVLVYDRQTPVGPIFESWLRKLLDRNPRLRLLMVRNKIDEESSLPVTSYPLANASYPLPVAHAPLSVSALCQGGLGPQGIFELKAAIGKVLGITPHWEKEREGFFTPRQKVIGERLREAIIQEDRLLAYQCYEQFFRGAGSSFPVEAQTYS